MGTKSTAGFTIIEIMLFLAVSAALAAALLVGSGVAIGQQRYRDSVQTLRSLIQAQYSQTLNVANDRTSNASCDGAVINQAPSAFQSRGTSDCVLMGRLLTVDSTGTSVVTQSVIGQRKSASAPSAGSDLAELQTNYTLKTSPLDVSTTRVAWGATVVEPKSSNPGSLSLLILRSPLSGSILTFASDGVQTDMNSMVASHILKNNRDICIDAEPGSFVGSRMAIRIGAYAADQSAVMIPSESEAVCD